MAGSPGRGTRRYIVESYRPPARWQISCSPRRGLGGSLRRAQIAFALLLMSLGALDSELNVEAAEKGCCEAEISVERGSSTSRSG